MDTGGTRLTSRPSGAGAASRGAALRTAVVVAVAYAVVGLLMLRITAEVGLAVPLWPSAGIAVGAVYHRGRLVALGALVGSFAVNASTLVSGGATGIAAWLAGAIAVGAALQAIVGAGLIRRVIGSHSPLTKPREVIAFLLIGGPLASIVSATIAVTSEVVAGYIDSGDVVYSWVTWWAGDSIGVMLFAPLTIMLFPSHAEAWRGRRLLVIVPSMLVAVTITTLFIQANALERARMNEATVAIADNAADALASTLSRHDEAIEGIGALRLASQTITAEEFNAFTQSALARFPSMQAASWNPVVRAGDLAAFETGQRTDAGLPDYRVTERDADGNLLDATAREEYVPVAFIEPIETNAAALGYDILSNPVRAEAIARARDTGRMAGTAPITLVQETGEQQGMLVLAPTYAGGADPGTVDGRRASIIGYGVGVYRLGDLVDETYAKTSDAAIVVKDVTDGRAVEIGRHDVDGPVDTDLSMTLTLDANGRIWQVDVTPTVAAVAGDSTSLLTLLLVVGVLLAGLFEALLLIVTGTAKQAWREAARSKQQAMRDPLTGLLNRRGFHDAVAAIESRDHDHVLLYIDLDGFKQVNDLGGHHTGDHVLQQVASAITGAVRANDVVARMGGDEFATILYDCSIEGGTQVASVIIDAVAALPVVVEGQTLTIGASIGAAVLSPPDDIDERMLAADRACYRAKNAGRGQVVVAPRPATAPAVAGA